MAPVHALSDIKGSPLIKVICVAKADHCAKMLTSGTAFGLGEDATRHHGYSPNKGRLRAASAHAGLAKAKNGCCHNED